MLIYKIKQTAPLWLSKFFEIKATKFFARKILYSSDDEVLEWC